MKIPQIKICGVNDARFAAEAERLGADYVGVIFAERSPRRVTVEKAREIANALSGSAKLVAVFGASSVADVAAMARLVGSKTVQLHRRASAADVAELRKEGFEVWALAGGAPADALLFDSSHGDGETMIRKGPWKTVLAGGIGVDNIADAVKSGADVIDASGSLEIAPGVKDVKRLLDFMNAFRTATTATGETRQGGCFLL